MEQNVGKNLLIYFKQVILLIYFTHHKYIVIKNTRYINQTFAALTHNK